MKNTLKSAIVECVPNFSEGRDTTKIQELIRAIESVAGVTFLGSEPGVDTNRTVMTFIGAPDVVAEAAFRVIQRASELIDMKIHKGAHPRMGATDVCPFIPVNGISMKECADLARKVGDRVGRELKIPVYLYEEAASQPERKNLADIRKGEYEGLANKLADPKWKPDYGPTEFNAQSGATVIGAREFLIAYNINLNSTDKNHAAEIGYELRGRGRVARSGNTKPYYFRGKQLSYAAGSFPCGSCEFSGATYSEVEEHCRKQHGYELGTVLLANDITPPNVVGKKVYRPGKFDHCKAIGWYVSDYQRAQVSINLTNFKVTPPHLVLDEARRLAAERGLVVTGSEIVGVVPYEAMIQSAKYYLNAQGKTTGIPRTDLLRTAVNSLGLSDVAPFEIEKKVLGIPTKPKNALVNMTVEAFTDEVSRETPTPGGGSISALAGALGAALASMVANLTYGKEGTEEKDGKLGSIAERAQIIKDQLISGVDDDTNAFNSYMEARRLPQTTPEEKAFRLAQMQEGLKSAIDVPWKTAIACYEAMELSAQVSTIGNPNSITDAAVGAQIAFAGLRGGIWNALINLKDLTDPNYVADTRKKCTELLARGRKLALESEAYVDARMTEMIG